MTGRCRCRCPATRTSPRSPTPATRASRLICCRNPALAAQRAAKRESLLAATETELEKIAAQVAAARLKGAGKIGVKVGKVINKRKVGKHFITDIADGRLSWRRDQGKIAAEAELDGIYVIRTSAAEEKLGTAETVEAYKDLGNLERDFWSMKAEDIDLRPIYHYLENRVRAHVFLCMLATYLTRHLRQALAPLTFTDSDKPAREDPVSPARRSATATAKDTAKITPDKLPVRGYHELISHLATLTRNTVSFNGQRLEKLSTPTPEQRRVYRPARHARPAPPRRSVTSVPTNGGPRQAQPDGKTPGQHPQSPSRRGLSS